MRAWNFYSVDQIKPKGWLKRQLEIQAAGLSGNLDKIWPDIRDSAWIGGDREGWERVPYWLDGFIPLAYLLDDEDMKRRAGKYIDAILERQCPDGWICPCTEEERGSYDTWAVQLITKVLTVYYDCGGDPRIPEVLYRILKNYYRLLKDGEIKLFDWGRFRWYECFIAIGFVYERYPEDWLKELGAILEEQGADYSEYIPLWERPLNKWTFETHIVNLAMMLKSEAVSHELLGREYTDLGENFYQLLKKYNGTPVETFTGDECLSGLSPIQGTELCAVVEQMYSYELLYAMTGDRKWAERLEVVAFNALPATISEDMWTHQYVQMSNQIACQKFPGKSLFRTNGPDAHLFGLEPNFGCCTANFNQGWPKLALSAFLHRGDMVINALAIPSELHTEELHIELDTDYPFKNAFTYRIDAGKDFTFRIRIPSFAENVRLNGEKVAFGDITLPVKQGQKLVLRVEYDTQPYFEPRPHGLNTVKSGSLVFSLPISHTQEKLEYESGGVVRKYPYCDYQLIPREEWSYAFSEASLEQTHEKTGGVPFSQEHPPVWIKTKMKKINWGLEDGYETVCAKVPQSCAPVSGEVEKILIPYGCARLRMTELPFVQE